MSQGDLARHYELIAAQMTVALVILENARWPVELGEASRLPEPEEQKKPDQDDSLENALSLLKQYQANFSPETLEKVTAEIKYIYEIKDSTATRAKSPLFGHYDEFYNVDYTQFTPRSYYTKSSLLRAYFRAMIYLGKNYYNLQNSDGMIDALLLAHIMATPDIKGRRPLEDWQRLMEITSFYVGLSDDISYPEWRDFIVKVAGGEKFTPGDALSPDFHKKIEARLKELKPPVTDLTRGEQVDMGRGQFSHLWPTFHLRRLDLKSSDRQGARGDAASSHHPLGPLYPCCHGQPLGPRFYASRPQTGNARHFAGPNGFV